MYKTLALLALALLASTAYAANDGFYAGVNYVQVTYKETGFEKLNPSALMGRVGKEINKNVAVEGRFAVGLSEDSVTILGTKVDLEIDSFVGLYLKGMIPSGSVTPYGVIGWGSGEVTAKAPGVSVGGDDSDISYGIGLDIAVNKGTFVNLEYGRLFKGDGFKVDALSAGIGFRF